MGVEFKLSMGVRVRKQVILTNLFSFSHNFVFVGLFLQNYFFDFLFS
jgi:hypothetical protein